MSSLPAEFLTRLERIVPSEHLNRVIETFSSERRVGFRINTLKAPPPTLAELDALGVVIERIPWLESGFVCSSRDRSVVMDSAAYNDKKLYFQNPSSMVPVLEMELETNHTVLDLAAAPGSKTLQIASLLDQSGHLAAVDIVRKRFFKLKQNLKEHGAAKVRVYLQDGRRADRYRPDHFDRVLLDAPCSTEGRFVAGDSSTFRYWSVRKIAEMAYKQKQLLASAIRCLRPGGLVVYSTCSFAPEENELVVQDALDTFGEEISIEPTTIPVSQYVPALQSWNGLALNHQIALARRILPDDTFEAFFVCKIRRH